VIVHEALSGQAVQFYSFPTPSQLPVGAPGDPIVYGTLGRPEIYG
jgi:hypothetical protein